MSRRRARAGARPPRRRARPPPERSAEMCAEFAGNARFRLERRLGEGAFGAVYEAFDTRLGHAVALKVLRRADTRALLHFKKEFRAMTDVVHRNLVRLGELFNEGEEWFFTMELVDGRTLLDHVWKAGASGSTSSSASDPTLREPPPSHELLAAARGEWTLDAAPPRFAEDALRDAFAQVAEGVAALHGRGMLHRDLKPSNVIVDRQGRAVVLDFGLVAHLGPDDGHDSLAFAGTPAYMSPEQSLGGAVSEASDWYAFGVMLYEALTGERPFRGTMAEMTAARLRGDPPPPSAVAAGVPADLDALCRALLRRESAARPGAAEVLRSLRRQPERAAPAATRPTRRRLVGRERQLAELRRALRDVEDGATVTVAISGRSGMGKTALARRFLAEVRDGERAALVLSGRCYQRESVPYKGLDSVVDELSRYLAALPPLAAARFLARDHAALARLFPVLKGVGEYGVRGRPTAVPEAAELRRRAFAALREMLARLAAELTVVVFVDDLQWGDADAELLLRELLRPPDAPPFLLLVACRSEDLDLAQLVQRLAGDVTGIDVRAVEVSELSADEARKLALLLVGEAAPAAAERAAAIAREAGGSPFFVDELVRHEPVAGAAEAGAVSLEAAIEARFAALPEGARRLLHAVALAARPIPVATAVAAARLEGGGAEAVDLLRAERWVRLRSSAGREEAEAFHDRIRETVAALLPARDVPVLHGRIAAALQAGGGADEETLAEHWAAAGECEEAFRHALVAADQAAGALAFDRAARLYAKTLELCAEGIDEVRSVRVKLADALAHAGRGADAARAYVRAAEVAARGDVLELRRRAAEQFLISGHVDEGRAVMTDVLAMVGMRLAPTPQRALLALLARRLQIALGGLRYRPRPEAEVVADLLTRIDVCWSVAIGLGMVDMIRGSQFQATNLVLSLRAGEPARVVRALSMECAFSSTAGSRAQRRTAALLARCRDLVEQVGTPYAHGLLAVVEAIAANLEGRFPDSLAAARRAESVLRERCRGVTWELDNAQLYGNHALANMGAWRELTARVPVVLADARGRNDLYLETYIRTRNGFLLALAADDPARAVAEQDRSLDGWSQQGFQIQHYWDWFARGEIDLYAGAAPAAWERLAAGWGAFRRSLLDRAQAVRLEATFLRARAAIAVAARARAGEAGAWLKRAGADAHRLERDGAPWGRAQAALARAGIESVRGRRQEALALATSAQVELERAALGQYAAAARWRRGALLGGAEGAAHVEAARAALADEGVADPGRMVDLLAPGSW